MNKPTLALTLLLTLNTPIALSAPQPWQKLKPVEQEALAPARPQWDRMPESQQQELRLMAEHYAEFTPEEKQRFHSRMTTWINLTPEQRQAARDKYQAFGKVPADKRAEVKKMIREQQHDKNQEAKTR